MYRSTQRAAGLLLGLILSLVVVLPAQAALPQSTDAGLDSAFVQVLQETTANPRIPGALMAIVGADGTVWSGASGVIDRESAAPLVADARFCSASISKTFVATVALQLIQEGWLSLDQNVEQWLPGLVPNGEQINVRQLLNHTSGLYDYLSEPFMEIVLANPQRVWQPQELVQAGVSHDPYFAPGEAGRWHYSNTNYVLLGLIIEQVTQNSLAHEIHQRIIDPLGLTQTAFSPDDSIEGTVMQAYEGQRYLTGDLNYSFAWGTGNIVTTAEDLARFGQQLYGGDLLSAASREQMFTMIDIAAYWAEPSLEYGLGVMRRSLGDPATTAEGHTGALVGYRTAMWYFPERNQTIVVALSQMTADPNAVINRALRVLRG